MQQTRYEFLRDRINAKEAVRQDGRRQLQKVPALVLDRIAAKIGAPHELCSVENEVVQDHSIAFDVKVDFGVEADAGFDCKHRVIVETNGSKYYFKGLGSNPIPVDFLPTINEAHLSLAIEFLANKLLSDLEVRAAK